MESYKTCQNFKTIKREYDRAVKLKLKSIKSMQKKTGKYKELRETWHYINIKRD